MSVVSDARGSGTELIRVPNGSYTIRHVIRDEPLDDALALRHARGLLLEPITGLSLDDEYRALQEALASDAQLSVWRDDPRYERVVPEQAFREHLVRVVRLMNEMRPWSEPVLRPLDPRRWDDYASPRVVGAIHLSVRDVESRIHATLFPRNRDGVQHQVAVLALRSGREVVLVGHWWANDLDTTAVMTRDPQGAWGRADGGADRGIALRAGRVRGAEVRR